MFTGLFVLERRYERSERKVVRSWRHLQSTSWIGDKTVTWEMWRLMRSCRESVNRSLVTLSTQMSL
jgi:hypothetical protein